MDKQTRTGASDFFYQYNLDDCDEMDADEIRDTSCFSGSAPSIWRMLRLGLSRHARSTAMDITNTHPHCVEWLLDQRWQSATRLGHTEQHGCSGINRWAKEELEKYGKDAKCRSQAKEMRCDR
jgi:hypothetical protein